MPSKFHEIRSENKQTFERRQLSPPIHVRIHRSKSRDLRTPMSTNANHEDKQQKRNSTKSKIIEPSFIQTKNKDLNSSTKSNPHSSNTSTKLTQKEQMNKKSKAILNERKRNEVNLNKVRSSLKTGMNPHSKMNTRNKQKININFDNNHLNRALENLTDKTFNMRFNTPLRVQMKAANSNKMDDKDNQATTPNPTPRSYKGKMIIDRSSLTREQHLSMLAQPKKKRTPRRRKKDKPIFSLV